MSTFYVYIHLTAAGDPFYVGKGLRRRCTNMGHRTAYHKAVVAKHGVEVLMFERPSEEAAIADEIAWIRTLRDAGFRLVNLTAGGDGTAGRHPSEQTKAKIAAALLGRRTPEETRRKQSAAHAGKKYRLGVKDSSEVREKIKARLIGNRHAVGNSSTLGFKHTPESRARMSASAKRRCERSKRERDAA